MITFFLAEMGDKTQIATVARAAHYAEPLLVVIGITLGMLIADVPAVFVGDKLASKIPMKLVYSIAATIFALLELRHCSGLDRNSGSNAVGTHAIGRIATHPVTSFYGLWYYPLCYMRGLRMSYTVRE